MTDMRYGLMLSEAIDKFGADLFIARGRWEMNYSKYREEKRSYLEDDRNGWALPNIQAGLRNVQRILKGTDEEMVKVYAHRFTVCLIPKQKKQIVFRNAKIAVRTEKEDERLLYNPSEPTHYEVEVPTFVVSYSDFDADECERKVYCELIRYGYPHAVELEAGYGRPRSHNDCRLV